MSSEYDDPYGDEPLDVELLTEAIQNSSSYWLEHPKNETVDAALGHLAGARLREWQAKNIKTVCAMRLLMPEPIKLRRTRNPDSF